MKGKLSRRKLLAGAAGLGGGFLAASQASWPPSCRGIFGVSDALTYTAHRVLHVNQPLAREFGREMITPNFPINGTSNPEDARYQELLAGQFVDWRLPIEGLVSSPGELPLAFFKSLPARTQITLQSCEEGWSAIGEWTGVQLSRVLQELGALPEARYVVFETVDGWWDSVDMADALHPQTLLAYGMNGGDLPVAYGAPLRLRVERQLGYKNLKYLSRITVTDRVDNIRDGTGSGSYSADFPWYAGI
ncbi:MAG: molybdopterin-dependent oxidoreductase [Bryobacterales bacterium]